MPGTLYDTLEVAPAASPETIAAAYRSLIGRYHPDRVSGLGADLQSLATERAKQINLAYETLRDSDRRAAYDAELRAAAAAREELRKQPPPNDPPPPTRQHPPPPDMQEVKASAAAVDKKTTAPIDRSKAPRDLDNVIGNLAFLPWPLNDLIRNTHIGFRLFGFNAAYLALTGLLMFLRDFFWPSALWLTYAINVTTIVLFVAVVSGIAVMLAGLFITIMDLGRVAGILMIPVRAAVVLYAAMWVAWLAKMPVSDKFEFIGLCVFLSLGAAGLAPRQYHWIVCWPTVWKLKREAATLAEFLRSTGADGRSVS